MTVKAGQKVILNFENPDFMQHNFVLIKPGTMNKVGAAAEEENHHPLIVTEWGKVTLQWWTHKIGGLHKNDFIMAAKSNEIFSP